MNFSLLIIFVFISPTLSETQGFLLPFPKLHSIFSKLKKRQGDGGYLEQCGVVEFGERNLGIVNVLAFFDASWQYSHRQAAMLKELKGRFERSGMVNIKFFVINSLPEAIMGEAEIEIEEETWKAISPSEAEGFPLVETSLGSLNKTLGPEFYLIEDKPQLQIWKKLHVSRDQILVVDGCGKLTYQVIVPWSILHFPYVKAAILSTYKDEPCGPCKQEKLVSESTFYGLVNDEEVTTEMKKDERTTVLSEIEESTTKEMETRDFLTTVTSEMEETTVEQMKTDRLTTEQLKTDGTTTEQMKTDATIFVPLEVEDSTSEEMETIDFLKTKPSKMQETTVEQMKTNEITTEQIKTNDTTTEKMETTHFVRTVPSKMDETTVEQMKRDGITTEQIKTDETTTGQIEMDRTILVPLEIEDSTTEKMKTTDFFRKIPLQMDQTTIEQIKRDGTTTEHSKTDGTILLPLEVEDSTTNGMETTEFLKTVSSKLDETTIEQMTTDGITVEQIKPDEAITGQIEMDRAIFVPLEIEDSTTEEMKTTDFFRKIPLQMDQTTIEQIKRDGTTTEQSKTDGTILLPLEVEDSTTNGMETTEFLKTVSSKLDETTIEQMTTDGITTEQIKPDEAITGQIEMDRAMLVPLKIKDSAPEKMKTTDFFRQIPMQMDQTTTEQTKTDGTTILFQLEERTEHVKTMDTEVAATTIEKPFLEEKMYVDYPTDTNYQGKDTKSEEQKPEKETLKLTLDVENDNSEDPEHNLSKFPNVRSISTENYKNTLLDQNFENETDKNLENSNLVVPIRIIMKAPHFDIYENSLIKHDYLILKTGDPDLHDHLDRGIKIDSLDENLNLGEGSADFENWADIWKIEDDGLNQNEDKINNENNNKTNHGWYGFHVKIDNDNKDSRKIKKKIFGKDESPGLFGEVADYWRNDGIENFYDESFDNENDKMYDMEKDPSDNAENSTEEKNEFEDLKENAGNSLNNEEEAKSKLIAHYSKLLPWIYYVLN